MITDKQREWLTKYLSRGESDSHKRYVYMKRIQERIDHMLENAVWLARNYPELFKDETSEIISIDTDNPLPRHRRLKKLIQIITLLYPEVNVWLEEELK